MAQTIEVDNPHPTSIAATCVAPANLADTAGTGNYLPGFGMSRDERGERAPFFLGPIVGSETQKCWSFDDRVHVS